MKKKIQYMSLSQYAKYCNVNIQTVYNWIESDYIQECVRNHVRAIDIILYPKRTIKKSGRPPLSLRLM
jgi:hypothetical protein